MKKKSKLLFTTLFVTMSLILGCSQNASSNNRAILNSISIPKDFKKSVNSKPVSKPSDFTNIKDPLLQEMKIYKGFVSGKVMEDGSQLENKIMEIETKKNNLENEVNKAKVKNETLKRELSENLVDQVIKGDFFSVKLDQYKVDWTCSFEKDSEDKKQYGETLLSISAQINDTQKITDIDKNNALIKSYSVSLKNKSLEGVNSDGVYLNQVTTSSDMVTAFFLFDNGNYCGICKFSSKEYSEGNSNGISPKNEKKGTMTFTFYDLNGNETYKTNELELIKDVDSDYE